MVGARWLGEPCPPPRLGSRNWGGGGGTPSLHPWTLLSCPCTMEKPLGGVS